MHVVDGCVQQAPSVSQRTLAQDRSCKQARLVFLTDTRQQRQGVCSLRSSASIMLLPDGDARRLSVKVRTSSGLANARWSARISTPAIAACTVHDHKPSPRSDHTAARHRHTGLAPGGQHVGVACGRRGEEQFIVVAAESLLMKQQ